MADTKRRKRTGTPEQAAEAALPEAAQPISAIEMVRADAENKERMDFKELIQQVQSEYKVAWHHMYPKWETWRTRLKLYNNQKRDPEAVGDPLLFTVHQTVMASLYDDQLTATFKERTQSDSYRAEHLNKLQQFDFDEMGKEEVDYSWMWDALFFGRGLVLLREFDPTLNVPVPENIDPMTFLRDPTAHSAQGDRFGRGKLNFCGWEFRMSKREIEAHPAFFNTKNLKPTAHDDHRSPLEEGERARNDAQGLGNVRNKLEDLSGDNKQFKMLNWMTYYDGDLVFVTLAEDQTKVVRFERLKPREGETVRPMPIIDRPLFPISHDWDGVSIPDLVEDKQRARAVLQNLSLETARSNLHPRFVFDTTRIKNRDHLNVRHNKHIPVDGDPTGAVQPVQGSGVRSETQWIMDLLDQAAQRATATPEMQQGMVQDEQRTATELSLVANRVDTRFSLAQKIFGWSERRFWREWYKLYKEHFDSKVDRKIIRVNGHMGNKWLPIVRDSIIMHIDPDVEVKSKAVAEAERTNELQFFRAYLQTISQDPNADMRYAQRHLGRLYGLSSEQVNYLLPRTFDELKAEAENEVLAEDEQALVAARDDDYVHMRIHAQAPETKAKRAHINAHKRALMLKKQRPELFEGLSQPGQLNPAAEQGGLQESSNTISATDERQGRSQGQQSQSQSQATQETRRSAQQAQSGAQSMSRQQ
jgi:hypothetical protein